MMARKHLKQAIRKEKGSEKEEMEIHQVMEILGKMEKYAEIGQVSVVNSSRFWKQHLMRILILIRMKGNELQ